LFTVVLTEDDLVCGISLQCGNGYGLADSVYISQLDKGDKRGEGRQRERHLIIFYLFLNKYEAEIQLPCNGIRLLFIPQSST
jgi:hypothetical protein